MDKRRHVRLPEGGAHKALPVSTSTWWPNDDAPPNALAHAQRLPGLLSEEETRKFGCRKVVHDGEADGGDEEGVYVTRRLRLIKLDQIVNKVYMA
jgi:hypothetical protein